MIKTAPALFLVLASLASVSVFAQQKLTPVFVQEVVRQPLSETLEALGTLRANEATVLSASVTETITAIHFDDGERVTKGTVLVEMTSAEEHALLQQAQSALDEAQRQYQRLKKLEQEKLTTQSLIDQRLAAQESASAELRAVQSRLQDRLIIAPFSGVVGLRNISVGALVRPGDAITTLDDDRVMKLDMAIPAVHMAKLKTGMEIRARGKAYGDEDFVGELVSIGSRIDPVTRAVIARAIIPNPDRKLKPGLLMTVRLSDSSRSALTVPEQSIIQVGRESYVYVIDSSVSPAVARKRVLELGLRKPGIVEVVSGLELGEQVVVHGTMRLRPDAAVEVKSVLTPSQSIPKLLSGEVVSGGSGSENSQNNSHIN
ncbi:efflux RND transporter periplasmic adaptor subunit [Teredinibacter waterburyi]|uniref:efflux RND transporter periplasmic adaptor subunit n=1 Tax=Teredinibacter waterburyi TaxID=1500538 RepID=UPI00165F8252|nr:efflux RND transporter periplasmic adaptor subunit [Teredinibacter waterburyi]